MTGVQRVLFRSQQESSVILEQPPALIVLLGSLARQLERPTLALTALPGSLVRQLPLLRAKTAVRGSTVQQVEPQATLRVKIVPRDITLALPLPPAPLALEESIS